VLLPFLLLLAISIFDFENIFVKKTKEKYVLGLGSTFKLLAKTTKVVRFKNQKHYALSPSIAHLGSWA